MKPTINNGILFTKALFKPSEIDDDKFDAMSDEEKVDAAELSDFRYQASHIVGWNESTTEGFTTIRTSQQISYTLMGTIDEYDKILSTPLHQGGDTLDDLIIKNEVLVPVIIEYQTTYYLGWLRGIIMNDDGNIFQCIDIIGGSLTLVGDEATVHPYSEGKIDELMITYGVEKRISNKF